jgi:hypothetical protein
MSVRVPSVARNPRTCDLIGAHASRPTASLALCAAPDGLAACEVID